MERLEIKNHFLSPKAGNLIPTLPFLEASNEIINIIDYLGPGFLQTAFQKTRADVAGNISKLKEKHDSDPLKYEFLLSLVEDEGGRMENATVSLLWLKRTLELLFHFSELLIEGEKENGDMRIGYLNDITLKAYELSLKRFHNFLLRGLFYLVAQILPSRESFINMLAGGKKENEDTVIEELKLFVKGLEPNLEIINNKYIEMNLNEEV